MTELNRIMPFDLQLAVWKSDWAGNLVEFSAMISENGSTYDGRAWDGTRRQLDRVTITENGGRVPTPWWHALPWVTEHVLRFRLYAKVKEGAA